MSTRDPFTRPRLARHRRMPRDTRFAGMPQIHAACRSRSLALRLPRRPIPRLVPLPRDGKYPTCYPFGVRERVGIGMSTTMKGRSKLSFATTPSVSSRMSRQAVRDTAPELAVRRALFASGERFRVAFPVPGRGRCTIDVAFPRRKVAVFIDGCFWHGCTEHKTIPRSNSATWTKKLSENRRRDQAVDDLLRGQGWVVVRAWEHEDPDGVCDRVREVLAGARPIETSAVAS